MLNSKCVALPVLRSDLRVAKDGLPIHLTGGVFAEMRQDVVPLLMLVLIHGERRTQLQRRAKHRTDQSQRDNRVEIVPALLMDRIVRDNIPILIFLKGHVGLPEFSQLLEIRIHLFGISRIMGRLPAEDHIDRSVCAVAFLVEGISPTFAFWYNSDGVKDSRHVDFAGQLAGFRHEIQQRLVVNLAQCHMVGCVEAIERRLIIVVQVVIVAPPRTIGTKPRTENSRRKIFVTAAAGKQIVRQIILALDHLVGDLDITLGPESGPPFLVCLKLNRHVGDGVRRNFLFDIYGIVQVLDSTIHGKHKNLPVLVQFAAFTGAEPAHA